MIIFTMLFLAAFIIFILTFNYLLTTLLTMEFMVLSIFLLLVSFSTIFMNDLFCVFFFLAVAVCESALGLSLVILYVRKQGNAQMNTMAIL